eukprot:19502-Heterococcus_DN1.PRE.2
MTTTAALLVGALAVRPTLRNRALQLCQHWTARAQAAVLAIQQSNNRRPPALMLTTFVVGLVLPILFLNYWVVRRAHNYIEKYVIRPEHMYRRPLTIILVAQLMVVTWPQHQLQFWCITEALGIAVVFYIALYTWSLVAQAARVKDADEVNIVEYGCMMLTAVESILTAINLCKKLLTMSTVAVLAAVKHAYNKCRSTACMALQAGVKHALATLSKTEYAYTRDMMTMCRRCDSSIAIAVNTPCGHTFLCWSCAEQYRDEHGNICNSCHEGSSLLKLQQQQMCVICQEQISIHDLFHIKQCGHQICVGDAVDYVKAMLRDASLSITHDGVKCPSYGCDTFITMHDIKGLTANSYGPNKLTIAECDKIDIFIQDAQLTHGIPVGEIVYCSAPKCGRPNILYITLNSGQQGPIALQKCMRCNAVLHGVFATDAASHHYIKHTAKLCPDCKYVKPLTRNCSIKMVARVVTAVANMRLNLHMHALTMSISHSSSIISKWLQTFNKEVVNMVAKLYTMMAGVVPWAVPAATNNNNNNNNNSIL